MELTRAGRAVLATLDTTDGSDEVCILRTLGGYRRPIGMVRLRARLDREGYSGQDVRDVVLALSAQGLVRYA